MKSSKTSALAQLLLFASIFSLALIGGACQLAAQDIAGKWYFTGYETITTLEDDVEHTSTRRESTLTITNTGNPDAAWRITCGWNSKRGTTTYLERETRYHLIRGSDMEIWTCDVNDSDGGSHIKLLRIDNDTWILNLTDVIVDADERIIDHYGIVGVLTKSAPPSPKAANWTGNFTEFKYFTTDDILSWYYYSDGHYSVEHSEGVSEGGATIAAKNGRYGFSSGYNSFFADARSDGEYYWSDEGYEWNNGENTKYYPLSGKFITTDEKGDQWVKADKGILFQLSGNRLASVGIYVVVDPSGGSFVCDATIYTRDGSNSDNDDTPPPADNVTEPVISVQPAASTALLAGKSVTLKVVATATGKNATKFTYQWFKDGSAIAGATKASYTVKTTKGSTAGAGRYTVDVKNSAGTTTSAPAVVSVFSAPAITTQPLSQEAVEGGSVAFTVGASGTAPFTWQWKLNGKDIPGATSATLGVTASAATAGKYTVVVGNSASTVTSKAATLKVSTRPAITVQPVETVWVIAGKSVKLSVKATGTAKLTYQWFKDGEFITGATKATYTVKAAKGSSAAAGTYHVRVFNAVAPEGVKSASAEVKVLVPVVLDEQPVASSPNAIGGERVTFTARATGTGPIRYQWKLNGKDIPGATSATLTVTASAATAGKYTVLVTNGDNGAGKPIGKVTSKAATLKVVEPASIVEQPAGLALIEGQSGKLAVKAAGTAKLTYQWYKDGQPIAKATKPALDLKKVTTADAGTYTVQVDNALNRPVSSSSAVVNVTTDPGQLALASLPVGTYISYQGSRKDKWETYSYDNTFLVLSGNRLAGTSYGDEGTYTYKRTGPTTATLTYTATESDWNYTAKETGTIKVVFISGTGGTYTASGNYSGVEYGERFSSSFKDSGTFTLGLP
ncbi:immunoglobulin domain-containing protein [Geminisphaera colitermitum]|uniref:immunoglobulin domain-containing protein n=1 Tax=Geminisphaera colitermitum TaxID=1148786 RepID=UPI000158D08B|nr:immunoglobulin domain-containing protein [Geminisphaera colitermitum]